MVACGSLSLILGVLLNRSSLPYSLAQGLSRSLLTWLISLVGLLRGSPIFTFLG